MLQLRLVGSDFCKSHWLKTASSWLPQWVKYTACVLPIKKLQQLVPLIRTCIQTRRNNQTDHWVNCMLKPKLQTLTNTRCKASPSWFRLKLCSTLCYYIFNIVVIIIGHSTQHSNGSHYFLFSPKTRGSRVKAAVSHPVWTTVVIPADQKWPASLLFHPFNNSAFAYLRQKIYYTFNSLLFIDIYKKIAEMGTV